MGIKKLSSPDSLLNAKEAQNNKLNSQNTASNLVITIQDNENNKEILSASESFNYPMGSDSLTNDSINNQVLLPNLSDSESSNKSINIDSAIVDSLATDSIPYIDSLTVSDSTLENRDEEKDSVELITRLSALANTNIYKSFGEPLAKKQSIDPSFGVSIAKDLSTKVGVISNLKVESKSEINTSKNFNSVKYSFGKEEDNITIETSKLYFVGLEVGSYYNISEKIKTKLLYTGFGLVNSKSNRITETNSTFSMAQSEQKEFGYTNGFKNYSHSLKIGFDYYLVPKFALMLNYNFGLSDHTINSYFSSPNKKTRISGDSIWN